MRRLKLLGVKEFVFYGVVVLRKNNLKNVDKLKIEWCVCIKICNNCFVNDPTDFA